ncbi:MULTISPECIES: DUF3290 family protein [Holzapfeliella]|uniref:DUF3290 family protein n=1 Tax=Holzapfeliella saturejae TaxID=3082953 RepID=A0ABU8SFC6_9LACO
MFYFLTDFWSYSFFEGNQSDLSLIIRFALIIIVLGFLAWTAFDYFRNKDSMRNRDILVVLVIFSALLVLNQYSSFQQAHNSFNNSTQVKTFLDAVKVNQNTETDQIFVNQTSLSSGMILNIGGSKGRFYKVQFNNDNAVSSYDLTETNLINTKDITFNK